MITAEELQSLLERIDILLIASKTPKEVFYKESGISSASYSQWNTGKFVPSIRTLGKIADFFGVSVDYLLGRPSQAEAATVAYKIAAIKKKLPAIEGEERIKALKDLAKLEAVYDRIEWSGEPSKPEAWSIGLPNIDASFLAFCHTLSPETIQAFLTMTKAPKELIDAWGRETNPKDSGQ